MFSDVQESFRKGSQQIQWVTGRHHIMYIFRDVAAPRPPQKPSCSAGKGGRFVTSGGRE
jgi:hypothetical protein